jgi:putative transposase
MFPAYRIYLWELVDTNKESADQRISRVSFPTFMKIIDQMDAEEVALDRGGQRAANAVAMPSPPFARSMATTRPFERAHIDHYQIDQHIVIASVKQRKITRRPWLTIARDEYTGAVVGMSLSFNSPSRVACVTVLRDIVRRYGRLPEAIVVDNGKEFGSVYFEAILARFGVSKQSRPPGAPRFGAPIETVFRRFKEEFLTSLPGSTSNDQRGRSVSRSHSGQATATWSILDAFESYEGYFWQYLNQFPSHGNTHSPWEKLTDGLRRFSCAGIKVEYDEQFVMASAIPIPRALILDKSRGIRYRDKWYVHPALFSLRQRAKVHAMWEPWDSQCIYALVDDRWIPCYHGHAEREAALYSQSRMLAAIEHYGCGRARAELEQSRQIEIANSVQSSKARVEQRFRGIGPIEPPKGTSGAKRATSSLPPVKKSSLKKFNHFDDDKVGG